MSKSKKMIWTLFFIETQELQNPYCALVGTCGMSSVELESLADHAVALGFVAVGVGIHCGAATIKFLIGDFEVDAAGENVKFNDVTVLNECKCTMRGSLGAYMTNRQTRRTT